MTTPTGVHLVGSVPLSDSLEVFRTAGSILGDRLLRMPDGEIGVRSNWIGWQFAVFYDNPIFETVEGAQDAYLPRPQVAFGKALRSLKTPSAGWDAPTRPSRLTGFSRD